MACAGIRVAKCPFLQIDRSLHERAFFVAWEQMNTLHKLIRAEIRVVDEKAGRVHAVVSTETKDRQGDVIRVAGWDLADFAVHPVLVQSHDYGTVRSQIGEWEDMRVYPTRKTLEGDAIYYTGRGNPDADWGFQLAQMGKAAYSVGFQPDMAKAKEIEGDGSWPRPNYEFNGQRLLEVSQVVIPANAEALQALKTLGSDPMVIDIVDSLLASTADLPDREALAEIAKDIAPHLEIPLLKERLDLVEATLGALLTRQYEQHDKQPPEHRSLDLREVIAQW